MKTFKIQDPAIQGIQVFEDYPLAELVEYIDWSPFFHAWEMKGTYPKIIDDVRYGDEARKLIIDGQKLLDDVISDQSLTAKAVIGIFPALSINESVFTEGVEFQFPRQLVDKGIESYQYSLADFIAQKNDFIGLFAVTAGHRIENLVEKFENQNDDYNAIMVKVLADRLAEALAERMHERVRKEFWAYTDYEDLENKELIQEKYQGIRPAPGYPACPNHSEKDKVWKILNVEENTGITLTENRAMFPAASVCGWYFSHPESKYFSVGDIMNKTSTDQKIKKVKLSPSSKEVISL